jgi:hypothetical protein
MNVKYNGYSECLPSLHDYFLKHAKSERKVILGRKECMRKAIAGRKRRMHACMGYLATLGLGFLEYIVMVVEPKTHIYI